MITEERAIFLVENLVLSCDHHAGGDFRKGYYEIFYVSGEENQQSSHQNKDTYYFSQAQRTE